MLTAYSIQRGQSNFEPGTIWEWLFHWRKLLLHFAQGLGIKTWPKALIVIGLKPIMLTSFPLRDIFLHVKMWLDSGNQLWATGSREFSEIFSSQTVVWSAETDGPPSKYWFGCKDQWCHRHTKIVWNVYYLHKWGPWGEKNMPLKI